jgi:hypothetical protein
MKYRTKRRRSLLSTQDERLANKLPKGKAGLGETFAGKTSFLDGPALAVHADEVVTTNPVMSIRDSESRISSWKQHMPSSSAASSLGDISEALQGLSASSRQGSGFVINPNLGSGEATTTEYSYEAGQDLLDLICFDAEESDMGLGLALPDSPTLRPTSDAPGLNLLPTRDQAIPSLLVEKNANLILDYSISDDILHLCPSIEIGSNRLEPQILKKLERAAGFLCAAQSKADAFDLYFAIFNILRHTLDFGSRHILVATLNCARSSERSSQHECAVRMLLHALRWQEERNLSNPQWAYVLHSYLSDVYVKMGKEKEVEIHDMEVMYCSDYDDLSRFVRSNIPDATDTPGYFPNNHQIALRLESRFRQTMDSTLQASGYTTSLPDTSVASRHAFEKTMDTACSKATVKRLLDWCERVIAAGDRSFDVWIKVLPDEPMDAQDFISQMLYCYLMERWLEETQRLPLPPTAVQQSITDLLRSGLAIPETIAALSSIIVDETFPGDLWTSMSYRSRILSKLHLIPSVIAPHLLATIRLLREESSRSDRKFAGAYQPLAAMSPDVGRRPITDLSQQALRLFSRSMVSTAQNDKTTSRKATKSGTLPLMPSVTELQSWSFRSQSLFQTDSSPQFSTDNRASPLTLSDVKSTHSSTLCHSLSTRPTTSSGISMESHSSWSFTEVTGMPRASLDEVIVGA